MDLNNVNVFPSNENAVPTPTPTTEYLPEVITEGAPSETTISQETKEVEKTYPGLRGMAFLCDLILSITVTVTLAILFPPLADFISAKSTSFSVPLFSASGFLTPGLLAGFLSFVLLESFCLSIFGYTPFKWLFKIKVRNQDGKKLRLDQALLRTTLGYLLCFTYLSGYITLIAGLVHHNCIAKKGGAIWDQVLKIKVTQKDLTIIEHFYRGFFPAVSLFLFFGIAPVILAAFVMTTEINKMKNETGLTEAQVNQLVQMNIEDIADAQGQMLEENAKSKETQTTPQPKTNANTLPSNNAKKSITKENSAASGQASVLDQSTKTGVDVDFTKDYPSPHPDFKNLREYYKAAREAGKLPDSKYDTYEKFLLLYAEQVGLE